MGRKMWFPGVALPVFLLFLSASVNSGPVIDGDGLLLRESESGLLSAPSLAPSRALAPAPPTAPALIIYQHLRQLAGPSPPNLGEMAPSYHCPESGLFAKDGSCRDYYKCEETSETGILTAYLFTCQPGMVFDDNLGTCDLASQVTTRPECTTEGTISDVVSTNEAHNIDLRVLRDVSGQNKEAEAVKQMSEGTDEICMNVNYVEAYVNLVMRLIPLRKYHEDNQDVTKILGAYDDDLVAAQNHAKVWKQGDSILIGIGETVKLAKNFEPEFNRMYEIAKERVKTIKENLGDEDRAIKETKKAIATLEERLVNATNLINMLPEAQRFLMEPMKTSLEVELVEKRRGLKENFVVSRELEELVEFLKIVKKEASNIRTQASNTRARVETFKTHLGKDKTAFERHYNVSSSRLDQFEKETIKHNQKLAKIEADKVKLESQLEEQRKNVDKLLQDITDLSEKAYSMRRDIMNREKPRKRFFGLILAITSVVIGIVSLATSGEKKEMEKLQSDAELKQGLIDSIMAQIEGGNAEIARLQNRMISDSSSSKNIQKELSDYTILKHDLNTMKSELDRLIPAIGKAMHGIDGIKNVFDSVIVKLDAMINFAKEAKTESEKINAHFYIYNNIADLQENWSGAYDLILGLHECTGLLI